ncbi:NADP-dependent oxidoreductase [Streptomyces sp. NA02950]|uniref:quinone oxidoreductase family protein n=1 Tax=Streptomyces sp. NA02950 TaxID=2742137 RepID=UPI001591F0FF|nr:NADP-dependent oxidoreductase [Streptomyces sp. NA02950]QKV96047.1 NADP-dependent oxidoreductase [Streptomyces sp. NA02950]
MRAVEVTAFGTPDVLRLVDRPDPEPRPGAVRVRIHATIVNPVDSWVRRGTMAHRTPHLPFPFTLGFDIAGTVLDDTDAFTAGQRVIGLYPWLVEGTGKGTNAEIVHADPRWLAPLPQSVDWATAATVPLNSLTARQSLDLLGCAPGETVLVTGASGAVGSFAAQLAAADGAKVVAVASAGDEAYVTALGVQYVLSREDPHRLVEAVRKVAPNGVDRAFDAALIGAPLLGAVRAGGGFLSAVEAAAPAPERGITVTGVHAKPDAAQLTDLIRRVVAGELTTRIADVLPIEHSAQAHRRLEAGGLRGKLVLTF